MNNMEKSYLEIKVTLLHVMIMLAGVIVIGIFLFYLGYQAGKSSFDKEAVQAQFKETRGSSDSREIKILEKDETDTEPGVEENKGGTSSGTASRPGESSPVPTIDEEMKRHKRPKMANDPPAKTAGKTGKTETVEEKTVTRRETYYSVQVGAFSSFSNAKNYAAKFAKLGYPTEILSATGKNNRILYRVRVGHWPGLTEAKRGKAALEKMENKKFSVKKSQ